MKQALILGALFIVALGGVAAIKNQKPKDQPQAQDDGWVQYEGPFIRFRYPREWKSNHWITKKTDQRNWAIMPPSYFTDKNDTGVVNINCYPNKNEKQPLDEIFNIKEWPSHKLVSQPKKVSVKNGQCITYPLEEAQDVGAVSKIHAYCYDKDGLFYDVWANIGDYMQPGKPTENVLQNAKIYEKLLTSLEFL
ncbi:MAG: hypothetical protein HY922_01585 [Elusimicrobia bacterium]|nr:hypothetical protein [Elusimicrobiota bacterium]